MVLRYVVHSFYHRSGGRSIPNAFGDTAAARSRPAVPSAPVVADSSALCSLHARSGGFIRSPLRTYVRAAGADPPPGDQGSCRGAVLAPRGRDRDSGIPAQRPRGLRTFTRPRPPFALPAALAMPPSRHQPDSVGRERSRHRF